MGKFRSFIVILSILLTSKAALAAESYVFILKWLGNPYWQALKAGIEETGKEHNLDIVILSPVSDQTKEEHLNLCQAAIARSPKMIILGAATTAIGLECFKQAQERGIQVADIDATVTIEQASQAGVKLAFTLGADNVGIGEKAAEFISHEVPKNDPQILILEGVIGSPPSADRVAGFKRSIQQLLPQSHIVNSVSAEWDRLRGLQITADTLLRTPDLNVIFAANDVMALGAVEAVRAAQKHMIIVGVDGVPDARKAIEQGNMTASITQLPYLIGKRAVEKAMEHSQGKGTTSFERAPLLILTKSVLTSHSEPLLQYVR